MQREVEIDVRQVGKKVRDSFLRVKMCPGR